MNHMSLVMRKPAFCIFGNHEADQRLCFRYTDSTIPLLPIYTKFQAYIAIVLLYSLVCVWDLVGKYDHISDDCIVAKHSML